MPAYPECYVADAARSLAVAADYALHDCEINLDEFAAIFVQSGLAELFGSGNPAVVAGMSGTELARATFSYVYGNAEWPTRTYADTLSPEYWAGWSLAQYQWTSARRFEDIFRVVPFSEIVSLYPLYHEMGVEHFCQAMDTFFQERVGTSRLKGLRVASGYTQEQLARVTGVNVRNIQMYEQRNNNINHASGITLYRLAQALNCKMEDLLENPV